MGSPLPQQWREHLGLLHRRPPEFFQSPNEIVDVPHAGALRDSFTKLDLSAVFCVQGVPTVAILVQDAYSQTKVTEVHAALWNQGLASVLLVVSNNVLRAFSLARRTVGDSEEEFQKRCLINTLDVVADVLALKELISGVESGRLWEEYSEYFPQKERVDNVLLGNLNESHRRLCEEGLSSDASQALLMQVMFIAYLEDRTIITPQYILEATKNGSSGFHSILASGNQKLLNQLFKALRCNFNGDLFVAPCSFEPTKNSPVLNDKHFSTLSSFRSGKEEMADNTSQLRFWGYDFKYIPVELISAVYDRFLGEKKEEERRKLGAYYTPMFLADIVIGQVWDTLTPAIKDKGTFFDPACGSGVFLVRLFQRLCDHWRATRNIEKIRWDSLLSIVNRLHGWDINSNAVRIAVFSLYIALLEQVDPRDFPTLVKKERLLPELWGKIFIKRDFFTSARNEQIYDVIIGNPPWTSRHGPGSEAVKWCHEQGFPIPSRETAWGFAWKSLSHVTSQGLVAFLLPAMGFLHNHSHKTIAARNRFIHETHILRVINFADLRFQLFEGANRPAALILFQKAENQNSHYRFEYWMPKADLNLRLKRLLTLSSIDKAELRSDEIEKDSFLFKRRLWMRSPDAKLFHYLDSLPKLGGFVKVYGNLKKRRLPIDGGWVIGQGFKQAVPERLSDETYDVTESHEVKQYPFLPITDFKKLVLPEINAKPWPTTSVHRKGFEKGFTGPKILVPRWIETSQTRLRACYTEENLTFRHIIQAITVPKEEKAKAKLLTAFLNSKLAVWFAFHGTASFGSERPEVQQDDLIKLPFPSIETLPEPEKAKKAADGLVGIIDSLMVEKDTLLSVEDWEQEILSQVDVMTYDYFCLSDDEISIIEDTINYIVPAIQQQQGGFPDLWKSAHANDRQSYAEVLRNALRGWLSDDWTVDISLDAKNSDLGILRLRLTQEKEASRYREYTNNSLEAVLEKFWKHGHGQLAGNFQLFPDFRIFIEEDLYLVKPMQKRFWLRSTALADVDAIAADLQHTLVLSKKAG